MTETARLVLAVDSTGVKRATADLDRLTKTGKRTEGAVGGLRRAFSGLAIGAGVTAGITAIIRNTIEAEKVQAQLNAVIKSTGGAAGLTAVELNKMSSALSNLTGIDDETITSGQSLLLTFTRIGRDVFPEATKAALNMSVAMGTDLNSAVMQVGKALNAPKEGLAALTRVGVQFTEEQKKLIETLVDTGRQADAQRVILKELETQFGGSAEAARNTLGGALQGLKTDFLNLLEGDSGSDGVRGTTQAINDLGAAMRSESTKEAFATVTEGMFSVTKAAGAVIGEIVRMAQVVGQTFGFISREAQLYIDGTKAALSLDLKGAAAARAAMAREYQLFEEARKDLLGPNTKGGAVQWIDPPKGKSGPTVMDPMTITGNASGGVTTNPQTIRVTQVTAAATRDLTSALGDLRTEMDQQVPSTEAQTSAVATLGEVTVQTERATHALDEARRTTADFFVDLAQNGASALDNLTQHLQQLILRRMGEALAESIFGPIGSGGGGLFGGGGGGGFLSGIMSLFGGGGGGAPGFGIPLPGSGALPGFAMGTTNAPGGLSWVGENGPELVNLPRGSQVSPSHRSRRGRGGDVHLHVQGVMTKETQFQAATRLGRTMRRGQG